jgi:hypothetical protein
MRCAAAALCVLVEVPQFAGASPVHERVGE